MKKSKFLTLSLTAIIFYSNFNFCYAINPNDESIIKEQSNQISILDSVNPVSTDRIIVDLMTKNDCSDLAKYFKDKDIQDTFGIGQELSEKEAKKTLKRTLSISSSIDPIIKLFTIKNLQHEAIGQIWVKLKTDTDNCIGIDYWLGKPFWGQAIVPEAVSALVSQIEIPNINISITLSSKNEKSKRAVLKIGERLGAFIKNSNGEYIPQTSDSSKFYLKEKIVYRFVYSPVEENESQLNVKLYKNDVELYEQNISKDIFPENLFKDSSGIEYIFSKLENN